MQESQRTLPHWTTAVLCGLIMIIGLFFSGTLITSYTPIITADMGISRTAFSLYSVIRSLVTFGVNLVMFQLVKRFSLKNLLLTGLAASTLNLTALTFCHTAPAVYVLGLAGGCSSALCGVVPLTMVVRSWFQKSYGTVLSIVMSSSGIGGVLISPAISLLTEAASWRVSFRVLAVISGGVFLLCFFLLHTAPRELGLRPYGAAADECATPESRSGQPASGKKIALFGRDDAAREVRMLIVITAGFSLGALGVYTNISSVMQDIGFSPLFATGLAISCVSLSNSVGKIGMGWISDHLGTGVMLVLWYAICPVSMVYFLLFRTPSTALAVPGLLLIGLTAGIYSVPIPLACSRLFRDKDTCLSAMSLCSAGTNLFYALSSPVCHGFYDRTGSYTGALVFSAALGCVSFVLILSLLRRNRQAFFPHGRQVSVPSKAGGKCACRGDRP